MIQRHGMQVSGVSLRASCLSFGATRLHSVVSNSGWATGGATGICCWCMRQNLSNFTASIRGELLKQLDRWNSSRDFFAAWVAWWDVGGSFMRTQGGKLLLWLPSDRQRLIETELQCSVWTNRMQKLGDQTPANGGFTAWSRLHLDLLTAIEGYDISHIQGAMR